MATRGLTKGARKAARIKARTQCVIDTYRGLPGEFYMLKGLLCLDTVRIDGVDWRSRVNSMLDGLLIAARMDELNRGEG